MYLIYDLVLENTDFFNGLFITIIYLIYDLSMKIMYLIYDHIVKIMYLIYDLFLWKSCTLNMNFS